MRLKYKTLFPHIHPPTHVTTLSFAESLTSLAIIEILTVEWLCQAVGLWHLDVQLQDWCHKVIIALLKQRIGSYDSLRLQVGTHQMAWLKKGIAHQASLLFPLLDDWSSWQVLSNQLNLELWSIDRHTPFSLGCESRFTLE